MKVNETYFRQLESWVKVCSVCLAVALPTVATRIDLSGTDWPRHVATVALLLSWLEMMFLLSRFPKWGYYVLMFGKVSTNVMKVSTNTFLQLNAIRSPPNNFFKAGL